MTIASPQTIIGPCGSKMVVLPLDEYERLRDAYHTRQDPQQPSNVPSSSPKEPVPPEVAERLLEGVDSKLKIWREYRGFTLRDLARTSKCSPAYISEIESGRKDGSLRIMKALSVALQLELEDLV